jgi:hypothetical protein
MLTFPKRLFTCFLLYGAEVDAESSLTFHRSLAKKAALIVTCHSRIRTGRSSCTGCTCAHSMYTVYCHCTRLVCFSHAPMRGVLCVCPHSREILCPYCNNMVQASGFTKHQEEGCRGRHFTMGGLFMKKELCPHCNVKFYSSLLEQHVHLCW